MFQLLFRQAVTSFIGENVTKEQRKETVLSRRDMLVGLGIAGTVAVAAPTVFLSRQAEAAVAASGKSALGDAAPAGADVAEDEVVGEPDLADEDIVQAQWGGGRRRGRRGRRRGGRQLARRCRRSRQFRRRNRRLCRRVLGWRGGGGSCFWFGDVRVCF